MNEQLCWKEVPLNTTCCEKSILLVAKELSQGYVKHRQICHTNIRKIQHVM